MRSIHIVPALMAVATFALGPGNLYAFQEGWEAAPVGIYVPAPDESWPLFLIPADEGDWLLQDTVTEFPDCGPTPHKAEVIANSGGHFLRLISGNSNSSCADNVWLALSEVPPVSLNPGFSIPVTAGSIISFDETGSLDNPQKDSPGCSFPPCGDAVYLFVVDNRGNVLNYVLQRAPGMIPEERHLAYREIFLDPAAGTYTRNIFEDLATIPNFNPSGVSIVDVAIEINEHGSVDIDNLCIGGNDCGSVNDPPGVDLTGTIKAAGGADICAMVLASGDFMFSCNPVGEFSLLNLPSESDGTVKRQIYADGFFPKIDILLGSSDDAVVMTRSGTCPSYNTPYNAGFFPDSAGKHINIAGSVFAQNTQTPICAMVLANGQHMFSCDGTGSYALNIPLDNNGQFKLQIYADGFAPSIRKFDEFKTTNIVRMARAVECQ